MNRLPEDDDLTTDVGVGRYRNVLTMYGAVAAGRYHVVLATQRSASRSDPRERSFIKDMADHVRTFTDLYKTFLPRYASLPLRLLVVENTMTGSERCLCTTSLAKGCLCRAAELFAPWQ